MSVLALTIIVILYLAIIAYLGYRGYRSTKTTSDYMIGGRAIHPYVMAMSYGATFISTSAIVGFGGAASVFGFSLLWLTFLNIFVGIFIAFLVFGRRTRKMGHNLDSHTFPEFLARRFDSRFIQMFAGAVIFIFMPLYSAAVLTGAARILESLLKVNYDVSVMVFSIIVAAYVIWGGLKGVMYTDAFQGSLMLIGMIILIISAYSNFGGITSSHKKLTNISKILVDKSKEGLAIKKASANLKKLLKEKKAGKPITDEEINMAKEEVAKLRSKVKPDNDKILAIAGMPKDKRDKVKMTVIEQFAGLVKAGHRGWTSMPAGGSPFWYIVVTTLILGVGIGVLAQPQLSIRFMTVKSDRELNRAILIGGIFILAMTGVAFVVGTLSNLFFIKEKGMLSVVFAKGNMDKIIPSYIEQTVPQWFGYLFLLTILAAAMSTLSSQFHVMGTSIGRDVMEEGILKGKKSEKTVIITKIGVLATIVITVFLAYIFPPSIIARATAIFFGLCASAFLPMYASALFWKGATKRGVISGMLTGFIASAIWLTFFKLKEAKALGISKAIFGKDSIVSFPWNFVDPIVIALPLAIIVTVVVSLLDKKKLDNNLLDNAFKGIK